MICALGDRQKKVADELIAKIIKRDITASPEAIIKQIYDSTYQAFTESGSDLKESTGFGLAFGQYSAERLYELLSADEASDIRKTFLSMVGQADKFNAESIQQYTKIDEIKKLVGVKDILPGTVLSDVTKAQVDPHLQKIKTAFPQEVVQEKVQFKEDRPPFAFWNFSVLKGKDGIIRLPEVTEFVRNNTKLKNPLGGTNTLATRLGTLSDFVVRQFIKSPSSFEDFNKKMLENEEFIKLFSKFSENTDTPLMDPKSKLLYRYAEDFLKDMSYAINYIQNEYKGYYLTDLTELLDKSGLTNQQKERFWLYGNTIGLKGELDLLAISPDGKFRVIDIKTVAGKKTTSEKAKYHTQASVYDLILEKFTGLKSEGSHDIVFLNNSTSNPSEIINKNEIRYKASIVSFERESMKNDPSDELVKSIEDYRNRLFDKFNIEVKTTPTAVTRGAIPWTTSILRGRRNMIFDENEPLSTSAELTEGEAWLRKVFPGIDVNIISTINSNVGGEFFIDAINLYERSNKGVAYHEGFHRFSQLYLRPEERNKIYDNLRTKDIKFVSRDGRSLNTNNVSNMDMEEFLAEEFRKYAINPKQYKFPKGENEEVKGFFNKIWDALKSIYNFFMKKGQFAYIEMFKNLSNGTFNTSNFSVSNAEFTKLNMIFKNTRTGKDAVLDNGTFLKYRNFSDLRLNDYFTRNDITIGDVLDFNGVKEIESVIKEEINNLRNDIKSEIDYLESQISDNSAEVRTNEALLDGYKDTINNLNKILSKNKQDEYENFPDFMRAYFLTSRFTSLRKFIGKNVEQVNKIVHEASLAEEFEKEMQTEEEELDDENPTNRPEGEDLQYDQSGNEKAAMERARDELKDFFVGIKRRNSSEILDVEMVTPKHYQYDNNGLPEVVPKEEAFNKTLEILQGSLTLDNMIKRLRDDDNRTKFPELVFIEEKLLGNKNGNEGIIPKFIRLTTQLENGELENLREFRKTKEFLLHFTHVLSMRNVDFLNFTVRKSLVKDREGNPTGEALSTRKSLELIINNIIGDFTRGFQNNSLSSFRSKKAEKNSFFGQLRSENILDIMYKLYVESSKEASPERHIEEVLKSLSYTSHIHDTNETTFFFNPLYAATLINNERPHAEQLKSFFSYIGININDRAYDSPNDVKELVKEFQKLKTIFFAFHAKSVTLAGNHYGNPYITDALKIWKNNTQVIATLPEGNPQRTRLEIQLNEAQSLLKGYAMSIFTPDPINQMLYDGQDQKLRHNPDNRVFALNRSVFENLARVEKKYHKRFSSGSMLVLDGLQYSYFLHNQMIVMETLINDHINSYDDFDKYPELNHLNPKINPQIENSWIFRNLFDRQTGKKIEGTKLSLANIAQVSVIDEDGNVEAKSMSELREDEKILFDYMMVRKNGSGEIRRLETSNTAYRISLIRSDRSNKEQYIKAVRISNKGFNDPAFLKIIQGYIQHSASKYKFYHNSDTSQIKDNNPGLEILGVWEELLGEDISNEIKNISNSHDDMNSLMRHIETTDEALFNKINNKIIKYFDDITLNNKDSYKNTIESKLSDKSQDILSKVDMSLSDENLRDFIANDFIMAMEDSLLFFGDYTYYKDPSKRRKIIGNNGSINMLGDIMSRAEKAEYNINSLASLYQKSKNITSTRDPKLIRKFIIQDIRSVSKYLEKDSDGKMRMIEDVRKIREQVFGIKQSYEQVEESKKDSIEAFGIEDGKAKGMQLGDAAAWISIDTFRLMHEREMRWSDLDELEYKRQKLILKDKLDPNSLTDGERDFISRNYSFFNIAKFATTGPVHSNKAASMGPTFDKMALRVLLPETDWDSTMRPVFEYMLANDIDYVVNDSGSKGYMARIHNAFSKDGTESAFNKNDIDYTEHAGGFFKNQLNTYGTKDKTTLSSQLRGIFFEMMLIQKQYGKVTPGLKKEYDGFIRSLSDYILVNSSTALSEMGLDKSGKIKDQSTFINYIKNRLERIETVSEDLTSLLSQNLDGTLSTYLEALPFQSDIGNLLAGIIDDNFRKIKLNGSKMFQTPEIGSTLERGDKKLPKELRGTVELKWHEVQWDENGRAISTSPVESKVAFKQEQWGALLSTLHPDGNIIAPKNSSTDYKIKRLNEAIKDKEWLTKYSDSITFIGVRIPLQDINFSSHMIIKEFLPEVAGDMIILPPEFYMQTGSDNDIDTVTATFKYLNDKGKVISRPQEDYNTIIDEYNEVSKRISDKKREGMKPAISTDDIQAELDNLKDEFIAQGVYFDKGKSSQNLDDDFTLVEEDGTKYLAGQLDNKSTLFNLIKNGEQNELISRYFEIFEKMNKSNKSSTKDQDLKKLKNLTQKRNIYIKGITNNIVSAVERFMSLPENYDFLTETDSINKIKELAAKTLTMKGIPTKASDLGKSKTPLENIGYLQNLINHRNNSEIRSILGSIVKFRRILTTLAEMDVTLNPTYIASSLPNLITKFQIEEAKRKAGVNIDTKDSSDKTYERTIYSPLLYTKDTVNGIKLSIFDESGQRTTKNLSMITSSLLDLFKNQNVFPSLGITWLNVKPLVFLMAQGVPLNRAILFLNNPIVQSVQEALDKLGTDAQDRHAIVSVSQNLFGDEIHGFIDNGNGRPDYYDEKKIKSDKSAYHIKAVKNGVTIINPMLRRHGFASEKFLKKKVERNNFKITEKEIEDFTIGFTEHMQDPTVPSYDKNLKAYLKNKNMEEEGKKILAYYSTLVEDGDLFYKFFVKAINRDSNKHNNFSSIANAELIEKARYASHMVQDDFNQKLREKSTQKPFYQDEIIKNMISNRMPEILNNKNIKFRDRFIKSIENITSQVFSRTTEDRTKIEEKVLADWLDMLYKNFYVIRDGNKINTPYEFFEYDITPLMRKLSPAKGNIQEMLKNFNKISDDNRVEALYSDVLFPNQLDHIRVKYPELSNLKIIQELIKRMLPGKESNRQVSPEYKDILNVLDQNFLYMNLSSNPNERMADEEIIRDEWKNLVNFDLSLFGSLVSDITGKPDRIAVYKDADNKAEISKFANLLAHYALTQSSHLNVTRGAFSRLAPPHILKDAIETSINNFNNFVDNLTNEQLENIMSQFETMFKDMNGELNWQNKQNPEDNKVKPQVVEEGTYAGPESDYTRPPKDINDPYWKAQTGKLYSKIQNPFLEVAKKRIMLKIKEEMENAGAEDVKVDKNNFVINLFNNKEIDPLNCSL